MLEQGRPCKLLRIDHENNKIKGVYHLPSDHSRDIMVVVVEASVFAGAFFCVIIKLQRNGYLKKDKRQLLYGVWFEKYPFYRLYKELTQVGHHVECMHALMVVFLFAKISDFVIMKVRNDNPSASFMDRYALTRFFFVV